MAHNTIGGDAKSLTLGRGRSGRKEGKRKRQQQKDYAQARHETKRKATQKKDYRTAVAEGKLKKLKKMKKYKGIPFMKKTKLKGTITSIADRMQARRRRTKKKGGM